MGTERGVIVFNDVRFPKMNLDENCRLHAQREISIDLQLDSWFV